jgi:DNA-directed RNA polymerase subunit RPC12/RpoP
VDYEFITTCAKCGKDFVIFWVMDPVRVGPTSVAKIACPTCGERSYQKVSDLIPFKNRKGGIVTGRPVRTVELIYDCPSCGMRGISVTVVHTDLSMEDLARETIQPAVCRNTICPQRGLQQKVKPMRTRLGALNPSRP